MASRTANIGAIAAPHPPGSQQQRDAYEHPHDESGGRTGRCEQQDTGRDDENGILQQKFCDHARVPFPRGSMIARFFVKLAASALPQGRDASRQASWSIRVPWPGGRGATCVGFGVRVPSAAAPFWTGGLSGALNTGTSGALTTTVAGTAEIFIGTILFVASDTGRVETNDW
jgi:hypothetical protein